MAAEVTIEHFATVTSTMELHICLVYVGKYAVVKFVKLVSKIVYYFFLPQAHEEVHAYMNIHHQTIAANALLLQDCIDLNFTTIAVFNDVTCPT